MTINDVAILDWETLCLLIQAFTFYIHKQVKWKRQFSLILYHSFSAFTYLGS